MAKSIDIADVKFFAEQVGLKWVVVAGQFAEGTIAAATYGADGHDKLFAAKVSDLLGEKVAEMCGPAKKTFDFRDIDRGDLVEALESLVKISVKMQEVIDDLPTGNTAPFLMAEWEATAAKVRKVLPHAAI